MVLAFRSVGLAINPTIVNQRNVHLSLTNAGRVDLISTNLSLVGVSRAIADGDRINIQRTTTSGVCLELLSSQGCDGCVWKYSGCHYLGGFTRSDRCQACRCHQTSRFGIGSANVRDGNVFIGGSDEYAISVSQISNSLDSSEDRAFEATRRWKSSEHY